MEVSFYLWPGRCLVAVRFLANKRTGAWLQPHSSSFQGRLSHPMNGLLGAQADDLMLYLQHHLVQRFQTCRKVT